MISCAAILLGGQGIRLRRVIGAKPKALAEIGGRPFIYYLLDQLEEAGIRLVVLCTGYGASEIQETLGDWYHDIKLLYSEESKPLGTAGALRNAIPYLNSSSVLILNGDSYCKSPLRKFIQWYESESIEAGLVTVKVQEAGRFGQIEVSANGLIESFGSKSNTEAQINAGIYLLPMALLNQIPENKFTSLEANFFPAWAKAKKLSSYFVNASFIDIGTPESLEQAQTFFGVLTTV